MILVAALEVAPAKSPASRRTVRIPRNCASSALAAPVAPPPITHKSNCCPAMLFSSFVLAFMELLTQQTVSLVLKPGRRLRHSTEIRVEATSMVSHGGNSSPRTLCRSRGPAAWFGDTLQFVRDKSALGMGGENVSMGDGNSGAGSCFRVLGAGTNEAAGEMGGANSGGVSAGNRQSARDMPAAVRDIGEA